MFGTLEYDKDPVCNFTDDGDFWYEVTNVYPNGTVARVVCKEGYGTYTDDGTGWAFKRKEWEVNSTCIDGAWTDDLDQFTTDMEENIHTYLMCEPDNVDWKQSFREDYFGMDYGSGSSGDEDAEEEEDSADNSTEPRLKCYQGYKVSPLLLRECKKGAKSCRSDRPEQLTLTCSDKPCKFNGKVVDTAVCYNTSAEGDEKCCCYGDGCNENTRREEFLAKGITVKSPSTCVGFRSFSHGEMAYSQEPTGTIDDDVFYVDDYYGDDIPTYPNGTVARLICDKGYASYRDTGVYNEENKWNIYEKFVLTFTCDNGGWLGEGDEQATAFIYDKCEKESEKDWQLAKPSKPTKEDGKFPSYR
ncbi:hypothetical protein AAVH_24188 [Aphelenchoides avenae]|nr:hypothetical protein AAVH_24188 [Aphelenchus avenae]